MWLGLLTTEQGSQRRDSQETRPHPQDTRSVHPLVAKILPLPSLSSSIRFIWPRVKLLQVKRLLNLHHTTPLPPHQPRESNYLTITCLQPFSALSEQRRGYANGETLKVLGGAANLCSRHDQYSLPQSYTITNSNIDGHLQWVRDTRAWTTWRGLYGIMVFTNSEWSELSFYIYRPQKLSMNVYEYKLV